MLVELLTEKRIQVIESIDNWQQSIEVAGQPLLEDFSISKEYITKIIDQVNELGPYIVIMPDVALPHTRPDAGVYQTSMSLLKLNNPVIFPGQKEVRLLFFLAAEDNHSHLEALKELAELLTEPANLPHLLSSENSITLKNTLTKLIGGIQS